MTQLSQAIAWTLIHFCWQAAAIAAAYRVVSVTVARRSSQTRYLVALSALLLMLGSAIATFGWELRSGAPVASIAQSASNLGVAVAADFPRSTAPGVAAIQRIPQRLTLTTLLPWIDGLWLIVPLLFPFAASVAGGYSAACASLPPANRLPLCAPRSSESRSPSGSVAPSRSIFPQLSTAP
jgi:hypothetical protein